MKPHLLATAIAVLLPSVVLATGLASPVALKSATSSVAPSATPTVPAISEALGTLGAASASASPAAPPTAAASTPTPAGIVAAIDAPPTAPHHNRHRASRSEAAFDNRQRVEIAQHIAMNTQAPSNARASGVATSYSFKDGQLFVVYGGLERITSIDLEPGEEVTGPIQAGDTVRWMVATVTSGVGATAQQHIIVKPTDAGAVTDMMIPTNKRIYLLDLRATQNWYMPSVRFTYPAEAWAQANAVALKQEHTADTVTAMATSSPESLHFDYTLSGRHYDWKPVQVFDDGAHTYIRMPANLAATDAPALFVMEGSNPLLVNYRVKGTSDRDRGGATYVVDRLFDRAELRVGTRQVVTIRRR